MKKYLRLILEILLGVSLVAASTLAYMNYSAKKHLVTEVGELTEQLGETNEALEKMQEAEPPAQDLSAEANTSSQELDALKAAFSNGVVLQDMELLYKAQKALSPERQVGMASIRLLTKGAQDEGTIAAFQKALEMAEWGNRLQTVCAAQNALAAAGQKVTVLSDCKKSPEKQAQEGKDSPAKKDGKAHDVHWGYEGDNGPEHWGSNFPVCGTGKKQSPLNIVGPFEKSKDVLSVDYKEGPLKILNNGHTIQVNVEPGSTLTINKETFDLLQFHFHRPSEEQVDGKNSAMVAHFVHKSKDGKLAVIGVMLNEGKDNAAIKTLWTNLPPKEGAEYLPEKVSFNPGSMLPKELGFYNYEGSLTTPPCTEGVQFYILKKPVDISKDQVGKFPFKLNARPVQSLNGRKINAGG